MEILPTGSVNAKWLKKNTKREATWNHGKLRKNDLKLKLTASLENLKMGWLEYEFPFGMAGPFSGALAVGFREGIIHWFPSIRPY